MSRKRVKIGESTEQLSVSLPESEKRELMEVAEKTFGGNASALLRAMFKMWKERMLEAEIKKTATEVNMNTSWESTDDLINVIERVVTSDTAECLPEASRRSLVRKVLEAALERVREKSRLQRLRRKESELKAS